MMLRLLCLLAGLLLFTNRLWAQAYEPGLLVRSNGDTLRGEIENDFWEAPPTFIRYRSTTASPSQLFAPRQLRAVRLTGGRHFRYEVLRLDHAAETRLESLPRGNYADIRTDSVLAEVLLEGPIDLRRVVLMGTTHYVLRRPGQPDLALSERKFLRQKDDGVWSIADGNNYHSQLDIYFIDCPAASQAAATAPFTAEGLAAVAQAYAMACSPGQQPASSWLGQARRRRQVAFQGGVLAGLRYNGISSPVEAIDGASRAGSQLVPFGGLYTELLLPSRTAAIYGELSVSTFRNRTAYISSLSSQGIIIYTPFGYHGTLGTARIGVRYYRPLAHDQQLIVGLGFEYDQVWGLAATDAATAQYLQYEDQNVYYPQTVLLPNLTLGWRQRRFTATLDGQLYRSGIEGLSGNLVGSNFAARLGLSYRLGRNPDVPTPPRP
ncbi:hypothetical protein QMK33_13930 [Hymenobacter sp. H14-R3]|uniref:hypothetical protein n=1 Tax=Hymenobacter sp. H14-R3 TaxID=3046308 RepID=UPI0024BB8FEC|nr:hypothetical protein [Hymenobacter sp. H14-R3]MDJ0366254.1 hypothetical protein [Hymenobacter sp. H14-R3]